jgi:hypothetical protein
MILVLRAVGRVLLGTPRGFAWLPVALWLGVITWLSSRPAGDLKRLGWSELLVNLGHAPLFGLLAMWTALALPREPIEPREARWPRIDRPGFRLVLAFVLVCGALDELHQYLGGRGRTFSVLDLVTNGTGAVCLLGIAAYVGRPDARSTGLWGRLLLGVLACTGAAALATFGPRWLPVE